MSRRRSSPRARAAPRPVATRLSRRACGGAGAPIARAGVSPGYPRDSRLQARASPTATWRRRHAGATNVAVATAEAVAEVEAQSEVEAEAEAAVEAGVQHQWGDLMWELQHNPHVVRRLVADHAAVAHAMHIARCGTMAGHCRRGWQRRGGRGFERCVAAHSAVGSRDARAACAGECTRRGGAGLVRHWRRSIRHGASNGRGVGSAGAAAAQRRVAGHARLVHLAAVLELLCDITVCTPLAQRDGAARALCAAGCMRLLTAVLARPGGVPHTVLPALRMGLLGLSARGACRERGGERVAS